MSIAQYHPQIRFRYVDIIPDLPEIGIDVTLKDATGTDVAILETSVFKVPENLKPAHYTRFLLIDNVGNSYISHVSLLGHEKLHNQYSSNQIEYEVGEEFVINLPGGLRQGDIVAVPLAMQNDSFEFRHNEGVKVEDEAVGVMLSVTKISCKCSYGRKISIPVRERLEAKLRIHDLNVGR